MKNATAPRVAAAAFGALMLACAGTAAASADEAVDEGGVEIHVDVAERYPSGVLALSVDADATALTEVDSGDPLVRAFTGTLPTVTVTDTRENVPDDPWYVLGTASDFVSGSASITADHLGWTPVLEGEYSPSVESGGDIDTVIDDPSSAGLAYADGELLYANYDQGETYDRSSWSASAGLQLKVDATAVAPGSYTSVLTLSLFE